MNQSVKMVDGPAIQPSGPLLSWLQQNAKTAAGQRRLFRLPVVVRFEDAYRLALGPAQVGVTEGGAEPIVLSLDDGGMKTGLLDTLRVRCPKEQGGCVLWLEGYWGALVEGMPEFSAPGEPKTWPFAVLRLGEMIDSKAQDSGATHAQISEP